MCIGDVNMIEGGLTHHCYWRRDVFDDCTREHVDYGNRLQVTRGSDCVKVGSKNGEQPRGEDA
jgi:hypothetical protein